MFKKITFKKSFTPILFSYILLNISACGGSEPEEIVTEEVSPVV